MSRSIIMLAALACGLWMAAAQGATPAESAQALFSASFEERLRDSPEYATSIGRHDYDDRWADWSRTGRQAVHDHLVARLKQVDAIPADTLSEADRLSLRLLRYVTQSDLDAEDLEVHLLRVQQLYGLHTRIYLTVDRMPAHTIHDYENIITRLRAVPSYVDQNIEILQESIARGLTQPAVVVDRIVEQLQRQ